jgi:WD40 repeat protein
LLRGARLEQIASWAETTTVAPSVGDAAYLRASVERRDEDRAAEAARQARERALERRSIRRLRGIVAAVTAAALVASVLTAVALDQRSQARREARLATARELAAAALANLTVDPERSILLALQAVETTRPDGMVLREANEALHSALAADRLLFAIRDPSTANVAWSPDGRLLATGGTVLGTRQPDVILWDAATGGMIHRLSGHTGDVDSIAFSPDGSRLVTTAAEDPRTIIWNTRTGRPRLTVPIAEGYPGGASFSPDGRLVAIGDTGDVAGIRIVDARTGDPVRTIGEGEVDYFSPSFSPDGTRIGARSAGDVRVYDIASGRQVLNIPGAAGDKGGVIYSPDGSRIATSCCEGSPTIWDARTGRKLLTLEGPTGAQAFSGVAWSADGGLVATGGTDGMARVWDARSGRQLISLVGHAGAVAMVAFNPDGTRLLTGGGDGAARVWDVTPAGGSEWMGGAEPSPLWGVAYSNDGSTILTTSSGGGGRMWNSSTGERVGSYPLALTGAFGPGSTIVTGGFFEAAGASVRVLRTDSGKEVRSFPLPWLGPGFAMSPDRSILATSLEFGGPALWDVASGTRLRTLHVSPDYTDQIATGVAFSPDGMFVASLAADALFVWEIASGRIVLDFPAHTSLAWSVTFSPDGSKIATSGRDGAAIWDATSGDRLAKLSGVGGIADVKFSPDGRLLATAGDDGKVRIWDVASGRETLSLGSADAGLPAVAFSPDGTKLASVGLDGILRVYVLPIDELIQLARARVTRGFTERECRQYLHLAACSASLARLPGRTGGYSRSG